MPSVSDTPTRLLAEFGAPAGTRETERARDIMLRLGGANVVARQPGRVQVLEGVFDNVWDATNAVVQIVEEAARWRPDEDPLTGIRMSLCTPLADKSAPELAELLLSRVGPGQILANAAAAMVAGPMLPQRIHLVDRGLWAPTPGHDPERVYELKPVCTRNGMSQQPSNLEWARRAVGYDAAVSADLTELTETWQVALSGKRRMVLLTAPPEQGRTGAAAELALRAHSEGALVLYGRWDGHDSKPFQAIRESLAVYASDCTTERLRADLEGLSEEIAALLPEVAARVSGARLTQQAHVPRARMFEAVERWLIMIARQAPTLLVLDDVHNAEPSSLDLLAQLWHALRQSRIMIVVVGSDEESQPSPALARVLDLGAHTEPGAFERMRLKPAR